jgi:hypothetical protein
MFKFLLAAILAVAAPACAYAKPNPLASEVRQTLFVKNVELVWSVDDAKQAEDPDYVAYRKDIEGRLKDVVAASFLNSPAGAEPVTFKITVNKFNCASTGGYVRADVAVVRTSDGAELGVYQKVAGQQFSNGGLLGAIVQSAMKPDVVGIMSTNFAAVLRARFDAKK